MHEGKLIYDHVTPVFWWIYNDRQMFKVIVEQGGTWSSKTYSINQNLAIIAATEPNMVITVTGQDLPNLKRGALVEMQKIVSGSKSLQGAIKKHPTDNNVSYLFKNGTKIEYVSYANAQDASSGKRDYLFCNEVNGMKEDIVDELLIRTEYNAFFDYNATRSFWVHEKMLGKPEVVRHISNFTHNPYAPAAVVKQILSYKETNPYRWRVMGLGLTGELKENLWLDSFSRARHVKECKYNPLQPLYISIDFNVGKFVSIAFQCSDIDNSRHSYFHVIDEFVLPSANNVEMAQKIRNRFGNAMLYLTGDQTGVKRDTGYSNSTDTTLSLLKEKLNISDKQMLFGRYNKAFPQTNPSHQNSWGQCNNVLSHHPNFRIDPKCKELINDCEIAVFVENKRNFELKKGDGAGKWAMNALDCLRYGFAAKCNSYNKASNILQ